MTLRFIDGADHYTTRANALLKWTTVDSSLTITATNARNGNCIKRTHSNFTFTITLDQQASWVIGFALRMSSFPNGSVLVQVADAGTYQCSLKINSDGTLKVTRGTSTALDSSATSSNALSLDTWYYVEWKVTVNNSISANTCKVNVNGVNWINVNSAQNLRAGSNNQANQIIWGNGDQNGNNETATLFDDIYILDGNASTPANNDFLGDVKVETIYPTGAGNHTDFTADSGSNYTRVNETNPDTTSYVESSTAGHIDSYVFGDLTQTPTSIFGVQLNTVAEKTDAGARTMAGVIRISSTDYVNATTFSPSQNSYSDFRQIYETDPSTSAAWGATNVNGAEYGFKLVA